MKPVYALSALCCLSVAAPLSKKASASPRQSRNISPYTSDLKRITSNESHPLIKRQSQTGSTEIVDVGQVRFLAEISFGDQTFDAILDTGSSDTWLIQTGFTCYDPSTGQQVDESSCNFGSTWTPDSTFTVYDNANIRSSYGSGDRYIEGPIGSTSVTLAGLTVPSQTVGAPNVAAWAGNGVEAGLIGMAFPGLTSAYAGTDPTQDSGAPTNYNSLFETFFVVDTFNPAVEPYFSLAISRDESANGYGGSFVIGGVPDATDSRVNSSSTGVSTPLVIYGSGSTYSYYALNVEEVWAAGSEFDAGTTFVVDSGAPYIYLPADAADAFNAAWSPAGQLNSNGQFVIDCAASTGGLAIGIGGEWLPINSLDLVADVGSYCISAVQPVSSSTSGIYVLGDPFLKNVVALYDWGNTAMEFYSRPFYSS